MDGGALAGGGSPAATASGGSPTATVTVFRFVGRWNRHWAWWQMLNSRWKLKRLPGASFIRQCGTGSREGFFPWPNFGVYGVIGSWRSLEEAQAQVRGSQVFRRYRDHAAEHLTVYLHAVRSRGTWSGGAPFEICARDAPDAPLAVLTRAAIRPRRLASFWGRTPSIRADIPVEGLALKIGLGEAPWLNQITFTIWTDRGALDAFAWDPAGPHGAAAAAARRGEWFLESLFARFSIAAIDGEWRDAPGLRRLAPATAEK